MFKFNENEEYLHEDREGWTAIEEITVWPDVDGRKIDINHKYLLNRVGKMVGFISSKTGEQKIFKKPLNFSKSHRKFKKIPIKTFIF